MKKQKKGQIVRILEVGCEASRATLCLKRWKGGSDVFGVNLGVREGVGTESDIWGVIRHSDPVDGRDDSSERLCKFFLISLLQRKQPQKRCPRAQPGTAEWANDVSAFAAHQQGVLTAPLGIILPPSPLSPEAVSPSGIILPFHSAAALAFAN